MKNKNMNEYAEERKKWKSGNGVMGKRERELLRKKKKENIKVVKSNCCPFFPFLILITASDAYLNVTFALSGSDGFLPYTLMLQR